MKTIPPGPSGGDQDGKAPSAARTIKTCPEECQGCTNPCDRGGLAHRSHSCRACEAEQQSARVREVHGSHILLPVSEKGDVYSYTGEGAPGHGQCCEGKGRFLCAGDSRLLPLPVILARIGTPNGTEYLLAADEGARPCRIPYRDIKNGTWATRIDLMPPWSPDLDVKASGAILAMAHHPLIPLTPMAPEPEDRDEEGRIPIPAPGTLPDAYLAASPYLPGESDSEWTDRMRSVLASAMEAVAECPNIALVAGLSAAAPYVAPIGPREVGEAGFVHLHGGARQGKSSTLELAASLWGKPALPIKHGIVTSWDKSAKGTARELGELGIYPAFLDESGTSDLSSDAIYRLIMSVSQGGSRTTATQSGSGVSRTAPWTGISFSTGNAPLSDEEPTGKFRGVPARLLNIETPFTGPEKSREGQERADRITGAAKESYGWAGPAVLRAFPVAAMQDMVLDALREFGDIEYGTTRTVAQRLALGVAGAGALDSVLGSGIRGAALRAARELLGLAGTGRPDYQVILDLLAEDMAARRSAWPTREMYEDQGKPHEEFMPGMPRKDATPKHGVDREIMGFTDAEFIYVRPAWWKTAAKETGVSESSVAGDLYRLGILDVSAKRRADSKWSDRAPRWAGQTYSYRIRRAGLEVSDGDSRGHEQPSGASVPGAGQGTDSDKGSSPSGYVADFLGDHSGDVPGASDRPPWMPAEIRRGEPTSKNPDGEYTGVVAAVIALIDEQERISKANKGRYVTSHPYPKSKPLPEWLRRDEKSGQPPVHQGTHNWTSPDVAPGTPVYVCDRNSAHLIGLKAPFPVFGLEAVEGEGDPRQTGLYMLEKMPELLLPGIPHPAGEMARYRKGLDVIVPRPTLDLLREMAGKGVVSEPAVVRSMLGRFMPDGRNANASWESMYNTLRDALYSARETGDDEAAGFVKACYSVLTSTSGDSYSHSRLWRPEIPMLIRSYAAANTYRQAKKLIDAGLPVISVRNNDAIHVAAEPDEIFAATLPNGKPAAIEGRHLSELKISGGYIMGENGRKEPGTEWEGR